ncbi:MAG: response regulator [Peptococcaceae bacterium]|nr:response regulator [Peptococcaceae bacterium]
MKLLIVDDQKGIRRLLTEVFLEYSNEIEVCANGIAALELIPRFNPDLIIMDIKMPGMSGFEVLKKLREKGDQTRVVLMTAYGDPNYLDQAKVLGVERVILKPFDLNELKEHIRQVLDIEQ